MAEPEALAQTLAASAPTRDFLRPPQRSGQRHTHAIAPAPLPVDAAHLLAAFALLLAVHGRLDRVALALRRHGRVAMLTLEPAPTRAFGDLVASVRKQIDAAEHDEAAPAVALAEAASLPGVLADLDFDGDVDREAAAPVADLVLRGRGLLLDADADLYRADSLPPLARQLAHLLASTSADSAAPLGELTLCDAAERHRVLRGFNALRLAVPPRATFASLIDEQLASQDPRAVCAVHGASTLSWGELDARSKRLAHALVACGIGPGQYVALLDRRGLDFVVALVAIWKAGGAYIPIDPGYPGERVRTMLEDSRVAVAVVGADAMARFAPALCACPALRHLLCQRPHPLPADAFPCALHGPEAIAACPDAALPPRAGPRDPAYMLYTSGSTGRPKGAIVRHDGAVNHLFAQVHALGRSTVAHFLQSAPSSSDISVWQFAAPLALGGLTAIVDDATDVARLLAEIRRHRLQLIELVPTVFKYLIDYAAALPAAERALPSLRFAMVTGEAASVELVNAWLALYPHIPIVNAYGPTEAADDVSQAVITQPLPQRLASVSIGHPLANLDLHVLDARLRPLPVGAWGEICVAGIGVGDGYWGQPEKTQEAFVANPFADDPGAAGPVLYRTGDIGRWRDDGSLECAGRLDHQVKLRGQRIELPEIEAVLRQHPGVVDAVVQVFHEAGAAAGPSRRHDHGRLVAFVVPAPGTATDAAGWRAHLAAELAEHLAARLPAAMLPATYVPLAALPLNPAGKVDRRALVAPAPAPEPAAVTARGRAPRDPLEALLARLWAEELGRPVVGVDDDFFALGGDSMSALAIAVAARTAGWHLRSADVLAHPSVARLARVAQPLADAAGAAAPAAIDPADPPPHDADAAPGIPPPLLPLAADERAAFLAAHTQWADVQPLRPAQQGLLLHWLLARDKRCYVDQLGYALDGELELPAFAAAWQVVVDRHPALRAGFLRSALAQPVQVTAREALVDLPLLDLSALDADAQAQAWAARCRAEVDAGFDLARPPLMRLVLARLGARRHLLAWTHHHLLLDGWSIALVWREVLALHAAALAGVPPALPPVCDDAACRALLVQADLRPGLRHWQQTLAGAPPAPAWTLPPPVEAAPGFGAFDLELAPPTRAALAAAAARSGVTLGTLLQAAWALLITRHTGCTDVVFGVVGSGRELPVAGIDEVIGLFVVTQPLRVDTRETRRESTNLPQWLSALQQQAALARQHEAVPASAAARAAALPPGQPLFETLFVLWNFPGLDEAPPGPLAIRPTHYRTVPAYPLTLVAVPTERLQLRLVHDRQRFDEAAIAQLAQTLQELLLALARGQDPRAAAQGATHG